MDLRAAVKADAVSLHACLEHLAALFAVRASPDVARQSLAQLAAEVEVLEQEGIRVVELLEISNILWLRFVAKNNFKVHHPACLRLFHLQGPHTARVLVSHLLLTLGLATVAATLAHLQLEWFADKIEQTSAHSVALLRFILLASLRPLLDSVHIF